MSKLLTTAAVSISLALGAITRIDVALVRVARSAITALLERESQPLPPTPPEIDVPPESGDSLPDQSSPPVDDAETRARPEDVLGMRRAEARRRLGTLFAARSKHDYFKSEDDVLLRLNFEGDAVVSIDNLGSESSHTSDSNRVATRGVDWQRLIEDWGPPDYCEAGEWYFATGHGVAGVKVHFSSGLTSGSEPLPWDWIPPEE